MLTRARIKYKVQIKLKSLYSKKCVIRNYCKQYVYCDSNKEVYLIIFV